MKREAILFFFGCSEVNSTWLITSELANQRARKALFTCVVYTNISYFFVYILGDAGPSVVSEFAEFFFDGNQTHSKVVSELKDNFLKFVRGPDIPPWYCETISDCQRAKVHVYV